jgi:hypothetical protein
MRVVCRERGEAPMPRAAAPVNDHGCEGRCEWEVVSRARVRLRHAHLLVLVVQLHRAQSERAAQVDGEEENGAVAPVNGGVSGNGVNGGVHGGVGDGGAEEPRGRRTFQRGACADRAAWRRSSGSASTCTVAQATSQSTSGCASQRRCTWRGGADRKCARRRCGEMRWAHPS